MTRRARKYLFDIQDACQQLELYVRDVPTLADYREDRKTRDAIARQLGIIGEAVNQYRREPGIVPLTNMVAIVRFCNLLIHAYDNVDDYEVWRVLHDDLPVLRQEVAALVAAES